jgi:hypothetical protein
MASTGDVLQTSAYEKTLETKFMKFLPNHQLPRLGILDYHD